MFPFNEINVLFSISAIRVFGSDKKMITSLFQIRYRAQIFASNLLRFNRIAFGMSIRISNFFRLLIRRRTCGWKGKLELSRSWKELSNFTQVNKILYQNTERSLKPGFGKS